MRRFLGAQPVGGSPWRPRPARSWPLLVPTIAVLVIGAALFLTSRHLAGRVQAVVVYTSQDQAYSEPILQDFERQTGIEVKAVYDSEAVKTVGLVNRLLAEQSRPQCDLFWNNEELRTRQLSARGVLADWATVGFRSRRMVVNTNRIAAADAPRSLLELTESKWRGRVALAYPLFGSTATHFLALRQFWGEEQWQAWCRGLAANEARVVDGNSVVVRLVGLGEVDVGLTDSDDIAAGQRAGYPIRPQPVNEETLLIPNTAGVLRGAPHPELAKRLLVFLQEPSTVLKLVDVQALEGMALPGQSIGLQPDWKTLLADLEGNTAFLREVFMR